MTEGYSLYPYLVSIVRLYYIGWVVFMSAWKLQMKATLNVAHKSPPSVTAGPSYK